MRDWADVVVHMVYGDRIHCGCNSGRNGEVGVSDWVRTVEVGVVSREVLGHCRVRLRGC